MNFDIHCHSKLGVVKEHFFRAFLYLNCCFWVVVVVVVDVFKELICLF